MMMSSSLLIATDRSTFKLWNVKAEVSFLLTVENWIDRWWTSSNLKMSHMLSVGLSVLRPHVHLHHHVLSSTLNFCSADKQTLESSWWTRLSCFGHVSEFCVCLLTPAEGGPRKTTDNDWEQDKRSQLCPEPEPQQRPDESDRCDALRCVRVKLVRRDCLICLLTASRRCRG